MVDRRNPSEFDGETNRSNRSLDGCSPADLGSIDWTNWSVITPTIREQIGLNCAVLQRISFRRWQSQFIRMSRDFSLVFSRSIDFQTLCLLFRLDRIDITRWRRSFLIEWCSSSKIENEVKLSLNWTLLVVSRRHSNEVDVVLSFVQEEFCSTKNVSEVNDRQEETKSLVVKAFSSLVD